VSLFSCKLVVTIQKSNQMKAKAKVTLYTRPGCHLCDEAKQVMTAAGCSDKYVLTEVTIDDDPELQRRYRYDIPVIMIDGRESFRHRLSIEDFKLALAAYM
jgi:glutaredoxin